MVPILLHLAASAYYLYVTQFATHGLNFAGVTNPDVLNLRKFEYRYLTGWNLIIQSVYFIACLLGDLVSLTPASFLPRVKTTATTIRGYIFLAIALPLTLLVATVFWGIYLTDRELIFPAVLDKTLPLWFNHAIHTGILVPAVLEFLLCRHRRPSIRAATWGVHSFFILYHVCYLSTYFVHGVWLYPIFRLMSWWQVVAFGLATQMMMYLLYRLADWGESKKGASQKQKQKSKKKAKSK